LAWLFSCFFLGLYYFFALSSYLFQLLKRSLFGKVKNLAINQVEKLKKYLKNKAFVFVLLGVMAVFPSCQNDGAWYPSGSVTVAGSEEFTDPAAAAKGAGRYAISSRGVPAIRRRSDGRLPVAC
jgi:hypothetical protein